MLPAGPATVPAGCRQPHVLALVIYAAAGGGLPYSRLQLNRCRKSFETALKKFDKSLNPRLELRQRSLLIFYFQ